ncbi:aminopeptidase P family protein [Leucobacter weissii]|uniref:Xaa-Pro aminopeptidase n=1 Tax=Leucobacter weissii TaxID=1983706 RepID=A0A939S7M2_9MICO|nr:aminopeptidase P family protein [Leucobacter weissii]MBO1901136.1 aminopeptidase P family protein [Leucobacter weissii]
MGDTTTHEAGIDHSARSTTPRGDQFLAYIGSGWAARDSSPPPPRPAAERAAVRRAALSSQFPGERLVIAAGPAKQRSNDTFFPYRAHSAFAHLTGWGSDAEPGALLVLEHPGGEGAEPSATLFFREAAGRDSDEFFADPEIGEFWVGPRPTLAQVAADLGIATAPLADFAALDADRTLGADRAPDDGELARAASELRLVKDPFEVAELQRAVDATARGFDEVIASLDRAIAGARGERVVEGVFNLRARLDGNTVGYETIAAAGSHACTLHWVRNDGEVREGDLLLLDAGVELDSLYTADITRTIPVSGSFSPVQRRVYDAVLEAADAARAIVRPGIRFGDVHDAAMAVIERRTREWGLPLGIGAAADAPDVRGEDGGASDGSAGGEAPLPYHRRYMVHGTSHHLGLDVHDCAQARREMYQDGRVEAGMVFTIEPGLYFQSDDLTVPEEYRGIGVRIEDDILVTEDGCINLSAAIPRTADEVEEWCERRGNASR